MKHLAETRIAEVGRKLGLPTLLTAIVLAGCGVEGNSESTDHTKPIVVPAGTKQLGARVILISNPNEFSKHNSKFIGESFDVPAESVSKVDCGRTYDNERLTMIKGEKDDRGLVPVDCVLFFRTPDDTIGTFDHIASYHFSPPVEISSK